MDALNKIKYKISKFKIKKKIVLDLGGKEVTLTVEQAKKLKEILSDMFGREFVKEIIHHHDKYYDWTYNKPIITYCDGSTSKYERNTVYWSV